MGKRKSTNNPENAADDAMADIESIGREMSRADYIEFLESIISTCRSSIQAAREDEAAGR